MTTAKKIEQVELLKDLISRAEIAIAMTYQGTTVSEQVDLRNQLRQADAEVRVVKNTLFKRAAVDAGREEFAELVDGPTALVFGYNDPVAPAKALQNYITDTDNEFVHIKQFIRKEYDLFSIHDENGKLAYMDRPYEVEAFKVQEELFEKFST